MMAPTGQYESGGVRSGDFTLIALLLLGVLLPYCFGCRDLFNGSAGNESKSSQSNSAPLEETPPDQPPSQDSDSPTNDDGLTMEEDAEIPPGPPGTVNVSQRDGLHVIEWQGTRDDTVIGYEVYSRCSAKDWTKIGLVKLHADDERNQGSYEFETQFQVGSEYTVAAVGADGTPGPKTADIN